MIEEKNEINAFGLVKSIEIEKLIESMNNLYPSIKFRAKKYRSYDDLSSRFIKKVRKTPTEYLLAEISNDWTVILDNQLNSDGCASILYNLNRVYNIEGLNTSYNKLGISFNYYSKKSKRTVNSYCENGKWVFYQNGDSLPFENIENYSKRKIKERFNRDILREYLVTIGINNAFSFLSSGQRIFHLTKM